MSYDPTNAQPALIAQGIGGGRKLWFYSSTDAATTVDGAGYFTDGWALGMRAGDAVLVLDNDASPLALTAHVVSAATAGTTTVDLSNGIDVGSTNAD
jgi:hypothetical protein